jgi:predicted membrane protein DUF2238
VTDRTAHLLLGDWTPVVRDPLDLLRAGFLLAAVVAAVTGDPEDVVRLLATFAVLVVARVVNLPRPFDLAVIVGMALQAFGNALGIFTSFGPYDLVVHFVLSLALAPTLYILLARLEVVPDLSDARGHRQVGVFLVTFLIGVSVGAFYEIYEWVADNWLGASLRVGYSDTISDLVDDSVAAACAGAFLVLWAERGWGTTRRVPADRIRRLRARSRV